MDSAQTAAKFPFSSKAEMSLVHSVSVALIALVAVVLTHQCLLGAISYLLNYETQITFGKVISKPFTTAHWSSARVLLMYGLPSFVFLLGAIVTCVHLHFSFNRSSTWYHFVFWCMVFSVLYVTTQFTLAPLGSAIGQGILYQGAAVLAKWWRMEYFTAAIFSLTSLIINLLFGFLSFKIVLALSSHTSLRYTKAGRNKIIRNNFVYPLLLLFPFALLLSFPNAMPLFILLLSHGLLWLPGLFISNQAQVYNLTERQVSTTVKAHVLSITAAGLIFFIRFFL